MNTSQNSHLPRLDDFAYEGLASVHWVFTVAGRKTGWLGAEYHARFRETLLHSLIRYHAICPAYCLMPDHVHLLLSGWDANCHQRLLVRFLRKHTQPWLAESGFAWQKQAYDNVIRKRQRSGEAFQKISRYLFENPVRSSLVDDWRSWPFLGAMIPGFPDIDARSDDYWDRFWKIYDSKG